MKTLGSVEELTRPDNLNVIVDLSLRRGLAYYLYRGCPTLAVMGMGEDVLENEPLCSTGGVLTDGIWLWRGSMYHYVIKYGVGLPQDFVDHAIENRFVPPVRESHLQFLEEEYFDLMRDVWAGRR